MRGKVLLYCDGFSKVGITPAYAGKRVCKYKDYFTSWDHPRVCGEKGVANLSVNSMPGSPPRMRGKAELLPDFQRQLGITPAYAGKSADDCTERRLEWDHPRVCGEKCIALFKNCAVLGSPPRMRGKGNKT